MATQQRPRFPGDVRTAHTAAEGTGRQWDKAHTPNSAVAKKGAAGGGKRVEYRNRSQYNIWFKICKPGKLESLNANSHLQIQEDPFTHQRFPEIVGNGQQLSLARGQGRNAAAHGIKHQQTHAGLGDTRIVHAPPHSLA